MMNLNKVLSQKMGNPPSKKMTKKYSLGGTGALEILEEIRYAEKWFASLSEEDKEFWKNSAHSEYVLDAWKKFLSHIV